MKIVTFDFFLKQTKTQDLMWFGKWTAQISPARAKPGFFMQHCSDSPNIFLYRFTSEKDQIDDWFCSEMAKTW
jgi:hypothetical protein